MWRCLLRWIAAVLMLVACAGPARAQGKEDEIQRGVKGGDEEGATVSTAALPAVVAVLSALLVLFIVCKPSRKF